MWVGEQQGTKLAMLCFDFLKSLRFECDIVSYHFTFQFNLNILLKQKQKSSIWSFLLA
jgi:hypothetical protein